jgi:nucleoside-diphosphate-sugar epimerase
MHLVTGATGLLGSHVLAELLKHGEKVRALYRSEQKKNDVLKTFSLYFAHAEEMMEKIDWFKGDILDYYSVNNALENVTKVYHTAALVSIGQAGKKTMVDVNVRGTANIVDACLEKENIKLCHVSSIAALGNASEGELIDENCKLVPGKNLYPYAYSKFKGEMEVWRGIHEGLDACIINPSVILGPGMWNSATAAFVERIDKGLSFYPAGTIGFVDVRDVSSVMYELMKLNITGERFVVNAENISYKDFFMIIAKELGKNPPVYKVNKMLSAFAVMADFFTALLTGRRRQISMQAMKIASEVTRYSNEKIKKLLNYKFISVQESIKFISEVYKKEISSFNGYGNA